MGVLQPRKQWAPSAEPAFKAAGTFSCSTRQGVRPPERVLGCTNRPRADGAPSFLNPLASRRSHSLSLALDRAGRRATLSIPAPRSRKCQASLVVSCGGGADGSRDQLRRVTAPERGHRTTSPTSAMGIDATPCAQGHSGLGEGKGAFLLSEETLSSWARVPGSFRGGHWASRAPTKGTSMLHVNVQNSVTFSQKMNCSPSPPMPAAAASGHFGFLLTVSDLRPWHRGAFSPPGATLGGRGS